MPITPESIETISKEEIAISILNILSNPTIAKKLSNRFKLQNGQQKYFPLASDFLLSLQQSDDGTANLELRKDLGIFETQIPEGSTPDNSLYDLVSAFNSQEPPVRVSATDFRIKKSKQINPLKWEISAQKRIPDARAIIEEVEGSRVKIVEIYQSLSKLTSKLPTRVKLI